MAAFRASAAGGGTSGTVNRTATITPAVGDLFVVFCAVRGNTNVTPTCSDDNGGAYTLVDANTFNPASAGAFSVFVRNSLLSNTTSTIVTVATGSNTSGAVHIIAVSGMFRTGSAAIRQHGIGNTGGGGTPAITFGASALTANVTIGAVANITNPAGMTAPTSWTERQDTGFNNPSVGLESVTRDSGFTGTTITWGSTTPSNASQAALELDGDNTGILDQTLADVTTIATGTVDIQGSASLDLDAVTTTATGAVDVQGAASIGLDSVTTTAEGLVTDPEIVGAADIDLDDVTVSASGAVEIQGAASIALDDVTTTAEGTVAGVAPPLQVGASRRKPLKIPALVWLTSIQSLETVGQVSVIIDPISPPEVVTFDGRIAPADWPIAVFSIMDSGDVCRPVVSTSFRVDSVDFQESTHGIENIHVDPRHVRIPLARTLGIVKRAKPLKRATRLDILPLGDLFQTKKE